jgi:hypothetical protein
MGPIDYSTSIGNPIQSLLQGMQLGRQIKADQQAQIRARQEAMEAQEFMRGLSGLGSPTATADDYRRLISRFPTKVEQISGFWDKMDDVKKRFMFDAGVDVLKNLKPKADGTYDTTAALAAIEQRIAAAENSGDKATAQELKVTRDQLKERPEAIRATLGVTIMRAAPSKEQGEAILDMAFGSGDVADLDKDYALNVQLYGKPTADRLRFASETAKGYLQSSGPAGSAFEYSLPGGPPAMTAPMRAATAVAAPAPNAGGIAQEPGQRLRQDGLPSSLTPEQYNATVAAMGKERTDAWIKSNGIVRIEKKATVQGKTFYQINGKWYDNPEGR